MARSLLPFRPASVVARMAQRNEACPLSLKDLLPAAVSGKLTFPLVHAPAAFVARAALLAAQEARSVLGLAFASGASPEHWFDALARAANEVGCELPIFLSAEVVLAAGTAAERERAFAQACRFLDAGMTHLAVDATALPSGERAAAFAEVAAVAAENGMGLECVLSADEPLSAAGVLLEELEARGVLPDVASLAGALPADADPRTTLQRFAELCASVAGIPLRCRGPAAPELLAALPNSPVKLCDDGGVAALAAARVLSPVAGGPSRSPPGAGGGMDPAVRALEFAASSLAPDKADQVEAAAFFEVQGFIERLGSAGSATRVAESLARQAREG